MNRFKKNTKKTCIVETSKNDILSNTKLRLENENLTDEVLRLRWQLEFLAEQIQYCSKNSPSPNCMDCVPCWIKRAHRAWEIEQRKNQ